jgi:hypothetical protein
MSFDCPPSEFPSFGGQQKHVAHPTNLNTTDDVDKQINPGEYGTTQEIIYVA